MIHSNLDSYLIKGAKKYVVDWCKPYEIYLLVEQSRRSKLGDYRKLRNYHKITINYDLHPELFFFTLTHEIAHLQAYDCFGSKIKPHGMEWKVTFKKLIEQSIHLYSEDLQKRLNVFKENPTANFYSSPILAMYFHNQKENSEILVKDLLPNSTFRLGKLTLKRGKKRKIKYLCTELNNKRKYLVHGMAPIDELLD